MITLGVFLMTPVVIFTSTPAIFENAVLKAVNNEVIDEDSEAEIHSGSDSLKCIRTSSNSNRYGEIVELYTDGRFEINVVNWPTPIATRIIHTVISNTYIRTSDRQR